jgi:hypothetical protein
MPQNHVACILESGCKLRVNIRFLLERLNLLSNVRPRLGSQFPAQALQHCQRLAAGGSGECHVERHHAGAVRIQLAYERNKRISRQRIRADFPQRLLINADDHNAGVWCAFTAYGKSEVQGALLNVLQEDESGPAAFTDSRVGKQD